MKRERLATGIRNIRRIAWAGVKCRVSVKQKNTKNIYNLFFFFFFEVSLACHSKKKSTNGGQIGLFYLSTRADTQYIYMYIYIYVYASIYIFFSGVTRVHSRDTVNTRVTIPPMGWGPTEPRATHVSTDLST